jgi:hypothetical protein
METWYVFCGLGMTLLYARKLVGWLVLVQNVEGWRIVDSILMFCAYSAPSVLQRAENAVLYKLKYHLCSERTREFVNFVEFTRG